MIGILSRAGLLTSLKLSRNPRLSLNLKQYLPRSSTWLTQSFQSERTMYKSLKPPTPKALKLQTSDGIPLSYDVIYTSFEYHTISQYLFLAMPTAFVTFGGVQALTNFEDIFPDLFTAALYAWVSILFLYINIGTAVIAYKSPVRIYHNKKTGDYKAVFNGFLPFNIRVLDFKKGMVEQIPPPDMITLFRFFRYRIKGQELYMFDMYFRYPGDLYGMFDSIGEEEE